MMPATIHAATAGSEELARRFMNDDVFRVLEVEGVQKFIDSWDELTESVRSELQDKK